MIQVNDAGCGHIGPVVLSVMWLSNVFLEWFSDAVEWQRDERCLDFRHWMRAGGYWSWARTHPWILSNLPTNRIGS